MWRRDKVPTPSKSACPGALQADCRGKGPFKCAAWNRIRSWFNAVKAKWVMVGLGVLGVAA
jgi:hypothetical protein